MLTSGLWAISLKVPLGRNFDFIHFIKNSQFTPSLSFVDFDQMTPSVKWPTPNIRVYSLGRDDQQQIVERERTAGADSVDHLFHRQLRPDRVDKVVPLGVGLVGGSRTVVVAAIRMVWKIRWSLYVQSFS